MQRVQGKQTEIDPRLEPRSRISPDHAFPGDCPSDAENPIAGHQSMRTDLGEVRDSENLDVNSSYAYYFRPNWNCNRS